MANELRQSAALLQGINTTLGLIGSDDGVVQAADQLSVSLNPWDKGVPELALHRQDFLWQFRSFVGAGGAGFNSLAQVHNDSTDAIIVVEGWLGTGIVGALIWGRTSTLATTDNGLVAFARDGRFPRPSVPYVRVRSQNNIAVPAGFTNGIMGQSNGATIQLYDTPIILRPQGTFFIYTNTANEQLVVTISGRARRLINNKEAVPSP